VSDPVQQAARARAAELLRRQRQGGADGSKRAREVSDEDENELSSLSFPNIFCPSLFTWTHSLEFLISGEEMIGFAPYMGSVHTGSSKRPA
jgi:hypothetical protein